MVFFLWGIIGVLGCTVVVLGYKLYGVRRAAEEIQREFALRLEMDTNTLIHLSHQDPAMRKLAAAINDQLRRLRKQRMHFLQGDTELKEAVTNISHDLRTPLTAICGYLELLEDIEKDEVAERYLTQITSRVEVMKQLTEELFRYSVVASVKELSEETLDLRRVLEESLLSYYGAMQQRGIMPKINICTEPVERYLDKAAVNRIFGNVISNALKYSDGDFEVTMSAGGVIVFANTARDLTSLDVERLFDRFYTVETGRNSSGLGLSIAKLLTEKMDCTIEAEYVCDKLLIILKFPCMGEDGRL